MTSACERCGTFADLWDLTPRLCPECQHRLVTEKRFWSSTYLTGVGALLNPACAAVLLAINFKRLGDPARTKTWSVIAAFLVATYGAIVSFDVPVPNGLLLPLGIAGGFVIGSQWKPTWEALRARGGSTANRWLPVIFTTLVVVVVVVVSVLASGDSLFDPATGE